MFRVQKVGRARNASPLVDTVEFDGFDQAVGDGVRQPLALLVSARLIYFLFFPNEAAANASIFTCPASITGNPQSYPEYEIGTWIRVVGEHPFRWKCLLAAVTLTHGIISIFCKN